MKRIRCILLFLVFTSSFSLSQINNTDVYHQRLYYAAKIWGYVKYFHSEVAEGSINWDQKLLDALQNIDGEISDEEFNNTIINMINSAGDMAVPSTSLPLVPDDFKYNLNLDWFDDAYLPEIIRTRLEEIRERFRPQANFYVGVNLGAGNPTFENDNQFYAYGDNQYPEVEYRMLTLFRYWNIINYFFPYKYIMDQDWDTTLLEFIPKMIDASDGYSFHLSFLELLTRIDDAHAMLTYSEIINNDIFGQYYLPVTFKYVENETVITGVLVGGTVIETGDIIVSIDGIDIETIREDLRKYTTGSNESGIEHNINMGIIRGQYGNVQIQLEGSNGEKNVEIERTMNWDVYNSLDVNVGPIWEQYTVGSRIYGYVDMERLETQHIDDMFSDLWETYAIIFDVRNYPNGTMWGMIKYLFDAPIHIASFTLPDINHPGTLSWDEDIIGYGDFSLTYHKPIIILFDASTISQAEYTVMGFEQHPNAVKIGNKSAGADGNASVVYLPGGISAYFTGIGCFYPDFTETQRIGIVPDIEVHPTIAGIREGRDEILDAAFDYLATAVEDDNKDLPVDYAILYPNYPNPFNPETTIKFYIPQPAHVKMTIYDMLGREAALLVDNYLPAGMHNCTFNGSKISSGVYFYKLNAGKYSGIKKLLLLK